MNPTTSNTLLEYSLSTLPDPLQVTPAEGNIVYGALSFVVSNGTNTAVSVTRLQFVLPVGSSAQGLTTNPGAVLWGVSPDGQWTVSMTSSGIFTAIPVSSPVVVTTAGIVFQLFNIPVNQEVGTVAVSVNETASTGSAGSQVRTAVFDVAKFPYGFYVGNFSPQVPMVAEGQPVTLTWEGTTNATYTMYWGDQSTSVTLVRSWTSPPLTSATSFLLRAQVVSQNETVTTDLTATVIVSNPDVEATSLNVSGASTLGDVSVSGSMAMLHGAQNITGRTPWTAQTDGFLLVNTNAGGAPPGDKCFGWVAVTVPYGVFWQCSGNYTSPQNNVNGGGALTLPMSKGMTMSYSYHYSGTQPFVALYFVPMGNIPGQAPAPQAKEVAPIELRPALAAPAGSAESVADALMMALAKGDREMLVRTLREDLGLA